MFMVTVANALCIPRCRWTLAWNSGRLVNGLVSLWWNSEQFCKQLLQLTSFIAFLLASSMSCKDKNTMSDIRDIRTWFGNPKEHLKSSTTGELAASSHSSNSTSTRPTEENEVQPVADDDLPEYTITVQYNSEQYDDLAAHVSIYTIYTALSSHICINRYCIFMSLPILWVGGTVFGSSAWWWRTDQCLYVICFYCHLCECRKIMLKLRCLMKNFYGSMYLIHSHFFRLTYRPKWEGSPTKWPLASPWHNLLPSSPIGHPG